jgi:hypothetical protein
MKNTTHTHTPGPWKLNFPLITAQDNMALTVAVVLSREDSNARKDSAAKTNAEAMANARLIAAAPELLAALILAVPLMQRYGMRSPVLEPSVDRILPAMISAIAKAEGKA